MSADSAAFEAGFLLGRAIAGASLIGLVVAFVASLWHVFARAGRPGWHALVPGWNVFVLGRVAGFGVPASTAAAVLVWVPVLGAVPYVVLCVHSARRFGRSTGFAVGMVLLPFVWWPILAFGRATEEVAADERGDGAAPGIARTVTTLRVAATTMIVLSGLVAVARTVTAVEEPLRTAIEQLEEIDGLEMMAVAPEEARRCIMDGLVERDVDPQSLIVDRELHLEVSRLFHECWPDLRHTDAFHATLARALSLAFGRDVEISTEETRCLVDFVWEQSEDPLRMLAMGDGPDDGAIFVEGTVLCLSEETITAMTDVGSGGYGDDPTLDALQDDCADGSDRACDLLYITVAPGSEYSAFAETCGGRLAAPEPDGTYAWCSSEVALDEWGAARPDDPGLDVLAEDCLRGDYVTCDLLFQIAPVGSEAEHVGFTCGNRLVLGGLPACRSRLGDHPR